MRVKVKLKFTLSNFNIHGFIRWIIQVHLNKTKRCWVAMHLANSSPRRVYIPTPKCLKTLNVLELISGGGWIQIKV